MKHEVIPDAFQLHTELDGIGHNLNCILNLIKDREEIPKYDQPSMTAICETLYSLQEHIFRISEDWMIHTEHLEERVKELSSSQPTSKTADQEGQQVAVEARDRMEEGKNQYSPSSNLNEATKPIRTASKAAESIGVSENTYRGI